MGVIQNGINNVLGSALAGVVGGAVAKEQKLKRKALRQEKKYDTLYRSVTGEMMNKKNLSPEQVQEIKNLEDKYISKAKFEQAHTKAAIENAGGEFSTEGAKLEEYGQKRARDNVNSYRKELKALMGANSRIKFKNSMNNYQNQQLQTLKELRKQGINVESLAEQNPEIKDLLDLEKKNGGDK